MNIRKRRSDRSGRAPMSSPGRPPVAGRDEQRRFWAAIAAGKAGEIAAVEAGAPPAVGTRWFRKAGGMPPKMFAVGEVALAARSLAGISHLWSERRSAYLALRASTCRRSLAISGEQHRLSPGSCGATPPPGAAGSSIAPRQPNGHAERAARRPKQAKLAHNAALQAYVQERLAGVVVAPSGAPVLCPVVSWKGRRHGPRQDRRWASAWSPEQIADACQSTSRKIRPCASAMKPSIKPY